MVAHTRVRAAAAPWPVWGTGKVWGCRWEEGESTEQGKHSVESGWRGDPTQLPRSTSTLLQGREAPHCPQHMEYLTTLSLCQHLAATAATNTHVRAGPCR